MYQPMSGLMKANEEDAGIFTMDELKEANNEVNNADAVKVAGEAVAYILDYLEQLELSESNHEPTQVQTLSANKEEKVEENEETILPPVPMMFDDLDTLDLKTDTSGMDLTPPEGPYTRDEEFSKFNGETTPLTKPMIGIYGVKVQQTMRKSEVSRKSIETYQLPWRTILDFEKSKIIRSGPFKAHMESSDESIWRFELEEYLDPNGVKHLSVFPVLVEARKYPQTAHFNIILHTNETEGPLSSSHFKKTIDTVAFTEDDPSHGIRKFIPFVELGAMVKPGCKESVLFTFVMTLYTLVPPGRRSLMCVPERSFVIKEPKIRSLVTEAPLHPDRHTPPNIDASIKFNGLLFPVDTKRINYYTRAFTNYYATFEDKLQDQDSFSAPDLGREELFMEMGCTHFRKLIEFFHWGETPTVRSGNRNTVKALRRLSVLADQLGIQQLKYAMEGAILEKLTAQTFVDICQMFIDGLIRDDYYPVAYEFMIANIRVIDDDPTYVATWEHMQEFYTKLALHCETGKSA